MAWQTISKIRSRRTEGYQYNYIIDDTTFAQQLRKVRRNDRNPSTGVIYRDLKTMAATQFLINANFCDYWPYYCPLIHLVWTQSINQCIIVIITYIVINKSEKLIGIVPVSYWTIFNWIGMLSNWAQIKKIISNIQQLTCLPNYRCCREMRRPSDIDVPEVKSISINRAMEPDYLQNGSAVSNKQSPVT